jgi:hypothetical protein
MSCQLRYYKPSNHPRNAKDTCTCIQTTASRMLLLRSKRKRICFFCSGGFSLSLIGAKVCEVVVYQSY